MIFWVHMWSKLNLFFDSFFLENFVPSFNLWSFQSELNLFSPGFAPSGWEVNSDTGHSGEREPLSPPLPLPAERAPLGLLGYGPIRRQPVPGDPCRAAGGGEQRGVSICQDHWHPATVDEGVSCWLLHHQTENQQKWHCHSPDEPGFHHKTTLNHCDSTLKES